MTRTLLAVALAFLPSASLMAETIDVALIPLLVPSPFSPSSTALPTPIDEISGGQYCVEIWVQDVGSPGVGVRGGMVDLHYTTALTDATSVVNQNFSTLGSGMIADSTGLVDDLGGTTFTPIASVAPDWARLAYVEFVSTGFGDVTFHLSEGDLQFARIGAGNVPWGEVDLTDVATVTITPEPSAVTQLLGLTCSAGVIVSIWRWRKRRARQKDRQQRHGRVLRFGSPV